MRNRELRPLGKKPAYILNENWCGSKRLVQVFSEY